MNLNSALKLKKLIESADGTVAVEFAIIAMLLFTLMFGTFEGGRVFFSWLVITNEAREGARWAAVRSGDPGIPDIKSAVESQVTARTTSLLKGSPTVNATVSSEAVTVQIDYTVQIITPMISAIWPNFPLYAKSTMRSE